MTSSRRLKAKGRVKISVADATFRLFREIRELAPPSGFELRMSPVGDDTEGGFYRKSDGKFVASWFHVVAVTKDAWVVAYLPTDCRRIAASLVPFAEVKRLPTLLRKAGCRVGSAKLLGEMMTALVPKYLS